MKRICAWCGKSLDEMDPPDLGKVTHGLCPQCRKSVFAPKIGEDAATFISKASANDLILLTKSASRE